MLAGRYKLPGADNMFRDQFNRFWLSNDFANASKIAALSPGETIRNAETIAKFKALPSAPNSPAPILVYFQTILEKTALNRLESVELCGPLLAQNKKNYIENWLE